MQYLIAYDVQEDRRRTRVAKCLQNFGCRIQFSVFCCDLETVDYLRMCRKVEAILDFKEDRLHIFSLCAACGKRMISHGPSLTPEDEHAVWLL